MKRSFLYIIIGVAMLMASCEVHTSDNGDLDGFWQLASVDTLATGHSRDMRNEQMSWTFQGRLLFVRYGRSANVRELLFRFRRSSDSLYLSDPYISQRDSGDTKIDHVNLIKGFGFYNLEEKFEIRNMNSSRMSLQSEVLRLNFRKY